jgi:hypothetical protein
LTRETIEIAFLAVIRLLTAQQRAGFGSERFGRLRCLVTRANLQPAVASYQRRPGDSAWRALALDVLRVEGGLIAEIVTFPPDCFPPFGLPLMMDAAPEMNTCH